MWQGSGRPSKVGGFPWVLRFPPSRMIKSEVGPRYLERHMDHLADSIAKLSQGRENWYTGREGIPVHDSSAYIVTKKKSAGD